MKKVERKLDYSFLCLVAKEINALTGYILEKNGDESLEEYGEKLLEIIDSMDDAIWGNLSEDIRIWYNSFNDGNEIVDKKKPEMIKFLVSKIPDDNIEIRIKDRPETEEIIAISDIISPNKTAIAYTEKWVGTKEDVGNKAISLYNKIRRIIDES